MVLVTHGAFLHYLTEDVSGDRFLGSLCPLPLSVQSKIILPKRPRAVLC
jgi:hypothetical protein